MTDIDLTKSSNDRRALLLQKVKEMEDLSPENIDVKPLLPSVRIRFETILSLLDDSVIEVAEAYPTPDGCIRIEFDWPWLYKEVVITEEGQPFECYLSVADQTNGVAYEEDSTEMQPLNVISWIMRNPED